MQEKSTAMSFQFNYGLKERDIRNISKFNNLLHHCDSFVTRQDATRKVCYSTVGVCLHDSVLPGQGVRRDDFDAWE
jgi:hypothetical protein